MNLLALDAIYKILDLTGSISIQNDRLNLLRHERFLVRMYPYIFIDNDSVNVIFYITKHSCVIRFQVWFLKHVENGTSTAILLSLTVGIIG